jgi:predicted NAD/FAD-dependent oxidoreductase
MSKRVKRVKHTPGPWHIEADDGSSPAAMEECLAICTDDAHIAFAFDDQKANARLIAAAPELLEACISALDLLSDKYHAEDGPVGKMIRAAIAKAALADAPTPKE